VLEFPIYSERWPVWHFLTVNRVYRAVQGRLNPLPRDEYAPGDGGGARPATAKLRRLRDLLLSRHPWKLDFNQCSGTQLVAALRRIEKRYAGSGAVLPVVLIGHSKIFTAWNERSLEPFLRFVADHRDRFAFGRFRDFDLSSFSGASPHRPGRPEARSA
jgi:hypothetical protein